MTTDQIKAKLRRLVADWKIVAGAYEDNAKTAATTGCFGSEAVAYAKAAVYRDVIWDLEQIIKEVE